MATPGTAPGKIPEPPNPEQPETSVGAGERASLSRLRRSKTRMRVLISLVALVVVASSLLLYRYLLAWESTDDAQIDGYIYPVSSRVSGYVTRVVVDDNQYVEAGTVLVQLDPKDYEVAVANAKATLANDQASATALRTTVPITSVNTSSQLSTAQADVDNAKAGLVAAERGFQAAEASLRQAEANDLKAQDDVTRYKPLAEKDEIPQHQYTQAVDSQKATAAAVEAARAAAAGAEASVQYAQTQPQQISVQRSRAQAAEAETERATAILQQAQLNLQYTNVVAPVSGIVGRRSVQPGQNVAPGQQMMTIVPLDSQNVWVTANFKETQLKHMRPGQSVKISVDTYGRKYEGHVLNIAGASGARYSLLPPENATGNYVKVVQRIPVKIVFEKGQDPEHLLRPGMSVEPSVKVQ